MTPFEREVAEHLQSQGWTIYNSGWPDFLCTKGARIKLIEVKSASDILRPNQKQMLDILAEHFQVRTAHPGPGFGDEADTNKFHLLCYPHAQHEKAACMSAHEAFFRAFGESDGG